MRSSAEHSGQEADPYTELSLLSEVQRTPDTTQRSLASRLGISLGLTNLLLRSVAHKGYVRVAQANWRRRLYALTPNGMVRRLLLTGTYINRVLDHYHKVKLILREELEPLALHAESRVAIYGTDEFAELVYLGLRDLGIEEMDIFAPQSPDASKFLGMPVRDVATLQPEHYDRVVIATLNNIENQRAELQSRGVTTNQLITFFTTASQESAMEEQTMDTDVNAEEG